MDPSFSGDGFASIRAKIGSPAADSVALQADGKLVLALHSTVSRGRDMVPNVYRYLVRLNPDGTLDSAFGRGGLVRLPDYGSYGPTHMDVAVQPNGRILATPFGGGGLSGFGLIGLTPSGELDPSFGGGDGMVTQTVEREYIRTNDIAIAADGRIVLAGSYPGGPPGEHGGYAVARLLSDGTFDSSFSGDGWALANSVPFDFGGPFGIAVRTDGRIVIAGKIDHSADRGRPIAALQFTADGALDPAFSNDGIATLDTPGFSGESDMVLDSQGRLVVAVAGFSCEEPSSVARFEPDGDPDAGFGAGGIVVLRGQSFPPSCRMQFPQVAVDSADRPLLVDQGLGLTLLRLTDQGTPDASFSEAGWSTVHMRGARFSPPLDLTGDLAFAGDEVITTAAAFREHPTRQAAVIARFEMSEGLADADGDGVGDEDEPCFEVYGDCPSLRRKVAARYWQAEHLIHGTVGGDFGCFGYGRAGLFRMRTGPDLAVARVRVSIGSRFRFHLAARRGGTYYVRASGIRLAYGKCQAARSNLIVVPD